mmetsp:Transcript_17853/g.52103  ORF Transcript_17853/g.52103 Transcript_17853/m.52103 type:complete len:110 (-) Transcript_17853:53-382(-)
MALRRSSPGALLLSAAVGVLSLYLALEAAFVGSPQGLSPVAEQARVVESGVARQAFATGTLAAKSKLSDEWVEMCKEYCDLKCGTPSKKMACKSHCGLRDTTRPLYNKC